MLYRQSRILLAASLSAIPAFASLAQTSGIWTSNASSSWSIASNWSGGVVPNGGGTATFALYPTYAPAGADVTLDTNVSLSQLVFDTPRFYTIRNTANNFINFTGAVNLNVISSGVSTPSLANLGSDIRANFSGTGGLIKNGAGAIILGEHLTGSGSNNTFTGNVQINGGTLTLDADDAALGNAANNVILNGGHFGLTESSRASAFITSRTFTMNAATTFSIGGSGEFNGVISGNQALNKSGRSIMVLGAANTYTGATHVNAGVLHLRGSLGSSTLSTGIFNIAGALTLDSLSNGNNNDRIANSATINLNGGQLGLLGQSGGTTTETIGGIVLANGGTRVVLNDPFAQSSQISNGTAALSTGTTILTAASLTRTNRSAVFFSGNNLGTLGGAQIIFTAAPLAQLVGGGGGPGSTNVSILPYAMGTATPIAGQYGDSFVTYGATGIRPLANSEYQSYSIAAATDNVLVTSDESVSGKTINSLNLRKSGTISSFGGFLFFSGSGVMNVTSGVVAFTGRTTSTAGTTNFSTAIIDGFEAINFGSREGIFHVTNNNQDTGAFFTAGYSGDLVVNTEVRGTNGITINGVQDSVVRFDALAQYTGDTTILGGNWLPAGNASIGASGDFILAPGTADAAMLLNHTLTNANIPSDRTIRVRGTSPNRAILGSSQGDAPVQIDSPVILDRSLTLAFPATSPGTFTGVISGPGTLIGIDGSHQIINGTNTYSGGTELGTGTWEIGNNAAFGTGTIFTTAIGDLFDRPTLVANDSPRTIANNWAFRLGGSVTQPFDTLHVSGSNDLTLSGNMDFGGFAQRIFVSNTALTTISGSISRGELAKDGPGTLLLSGNSTYEGRTVITEGALQVSSANALGGTGTGTTIETDATLELLNVTTPEPITVAGNGGTFNGGLRSLGTANTLTGTLTLASGSSVYVDTASTLAVAGAMAGNVLSTKAGSGTLVISGNSPGYAGTLTQTFGVTRLSGNNAAGSGTLIIGSGSALEITGGSSTNVVARINGDGIAGTGGLRNLSGSNSVRIVTLQNATSNTVAVDSGMLTVNQYVDGAGLPLTKTGPGTLIAGAFQDIGALTINAGTVGVSPNGSDGRTAIIGSLAVSGGGKLDLADNDAILQFQDLATTGGQIIAGFNNGAWNGSGIVASAAAVAISPRTGLGYGLQSDVNLPARNLDFGYGPYSPAATDVIVRYTALGDANLSGTVESTDFNRLLAGYGKLTGALWTEGDFNYDSKVNTLDFNFLAGNFGVTVAGSIPGASLGSVVPEPASIGLLALMMGIGSRRRRLA